MADNKIDLKSIYQLLYMNFFIPSYQRGYRWTEQQVKDLLNDIGDFAHKKHKDYEFYCLQPLVVRSMTDDEKEKNGLRVNETWYEVIDGQQRLTTLFLILLSIKGYLEITRKSLKRYKLIFQREPSKGSDYLEQICDLNKIDDSKIDYSKIDYFHISQSFKTINKWLDEKQKDPKFEFSDFCKAIMSYSPDDTETKRDRANNVRVIWYESVNEDPVKVFTRLNIGKISLTNAELIKALLLNRGNFTNEGNTYRLRQQEIAEEWDHIEYTLQNNEFWLFLHQVGYDRPTRIDFIFDLICAHNNLNLSEEQMSRIGDDEHRTFRYFDEYFKSNSADIKSCWDIVKHYFYSFEEWYNDIIFFHYVGYLIATGRQTIDSIMKAWNEYTSKGDFTKYLKEQIRYCLNIDIDSLDSNVFQCKEDGSNKGYLRPLLLFHNIQTVINQNCAWQSNEKYSMGVFYKFPFHLYKLEDWDVEHIASNTSNPENTIEAQAEWLVNVYLGADKETQEKITSYFSVGNQEKQNALFQEIKSKFPIHDEWSLKEKNRLWNYTLLDSSTNRSYGNAIFSGKRRVIIGKDKGVKIGIPKLSRDKTQMFIGEENPGVSSFVPPCTKQVFMKYYSVTSGDVNYWNKETDAVAYLNDIKKCIKQIYE